VAVVDLREHDGGRRGDGGRPRDPELGRLRGDDADERDREHGNGNQDLLQHVSSPI
jgi:hypothetical protein